jgi:hypothetical protein
VRLVVALAAVAMAVLPACATAQARIGLVSEPGAAGARPAAAAVAVGEVLFEIEVTGRAHSPADRAVLMVTFSAWGDSAASARTAGQAMRDRLVAIARGFDAHPIAGPNTVGLPGAFGFGGDSVTILSGEEGGSRADGRFAAMGAAQLRLGSPQRAAELKTALEQAGVTMATGPVYLLDDESEARRRARDDALTDARDEADRFARSQGMRVARLVSFSESSGETFAWQALLSQWAGQSPSASGQVETSLTARVAFALVPQ